MRPGRGESTQESSTGSSPVGEGARGTRCGRCYSLCRFWGSGSRRLSATTLLRCILCMDHVSLLFHYGFMPICDNLCEDSASVSRLVCSSPVFGVRSCIMRHCIFHVMKRCHIYLEMCTNSTLCARWALNIAAEAPLPHFPCPVVRRLCGGRMRAVSPQYSQF